MDIIGTGNSILEKINEYSQKWATAQSDYDSGRITLEDKIRLQGEYHSEAEGLRSLLGYSGGADGSEFVVTDSKKATSIVRNATDKVKGTIESVLSVNADPKYINNIPFLGNGILGGSVGEQIRAIQGYLTGDLSADQVKDIALNIDLLNDRINSLSEGNNSTDVPSLGTGDSNEDIEKAGTLVWLERNKFWIIGSIAALMGLAILDD